LGVDTNIAGEERIGGFKFVRTLHPGASSSVLEVVQESTGRRFAMKMLHASRAEDPAERRNFAYEAKVGRELRHPNLIRVHEYFKDPVQPYFVMDLFPAYHLKLPIARPSVYPMPVAQLHRIMEQVASALAYMHETGWVHRDVKPENILVNKSGDARLIDYALARRPASGLARLFRRKGVVQGTRSYMSPEQIRGKPPDPSADIYSFGITCYELACGRPPFRANSENELLNKHLWERPVPLTAHNKAITSEFNDLVMTMIRKKPAERPASLREFMSRFSGIRIYKTDPDPTAARDLGRF
jgi:serine/threonine protein kinase